ncbi:DUF2334 domain-containing protein [Halobacillus litoralis]|uniref:DUF2334 domain-containing protein n=1 Tax=Halobacillus litoralis TaxID=45668 RepID=UPI001CD547B6|nr:DUF2334 domain-containing protein [Halobacillus litoralis]MCA0971423.1 DUF2334 domain-containing protein [Halobacillus litoralis]
MRTHHALLLCVLTFLIWPTYVSADEEAPAVLLLYSIEAEEDMQDVHRVDLLTGHFSSDITSLSVEEFLESGKEIDTFDHVVYVRLKTSKPSKKTTELLNSYNGPTYYLGWEMEAFQDGSFLTRLGEGVFQTVVSEENTTKLRTKKLITHYQISPATQVLYSTQEEEIPLIFKNDHNFFAPITDTSGKTGAYVGESMFSFFDQKKNKGKMSLRLEDIDPTTKPNTLKKIADYLHEKDIPYMITVIPVYTSPKTEEKLHMSDAPELTSVLRRMQDQGASIILHGYKHQYLKTVTGEGFEYWDVKNDRPLYQKPDEERLNRGGFSSQEEYDNYVKEGIQFERNYIQNTLSNGVQELVAEGLYPVAFEAPHYAMSLSGYHVLSEHFSTYVGQVQLSNNTYKAVYSPPFQTEPAMLDGMQLVPETLGYLPIGEEKEAIKRIVNRYQYYSQFSDHLSGMFYHPYLGVSHLKEVITELEKQGPIDWYDLRDQQNRVEVNDVVIETKSGEIQTNVEENSFFTWTIWWALAPLLIGGTVLFTQRKPAKRRDGSRVS